MNIKITHDPCPPEWHFHTMKLLCLPLLVIFTEHNKNIGHWSTPEKLQIKTQRIVSAVPVKNKTWYPPKEAIQVGDPICCFSYGCGSTQLFLPDWTIPSALGVLHTQPSLTTALCEDGLFPQGLHPSWGQPPSDDWQINGGRKRSDLLAPVGDISESPDQLRSSPCSQLRPLLGP